MTKLDVTNLEFPDASFDAILCSHVLEHVSDFSAATRELLRVTRPGGWAILDAPVNADLEDTYEDWSITEPEKRRIAFGQTDHVRVFGRNYPDLLRQHGWEVDVDPMILSEAESREYRLRRDLDHIYFCRRPDNQSSP